MTSRDETVKKSSTYVSDKINNIGVAYDLKKKKIKIKFKSIVCKMHKGNVDKRDQ